MPALKKSDKKWTKRISVKSRAVDCLGSRGVARGGAEGARAPPEFGRSVNPIQTREEDYAPHTTASPPPPIQKSIYTSVCT